MTAVACTDAPADRTGGRPGERSPAASPTTPAPEREPDREPASFHATCELAHAPCRRRQPLILGALRACPRLEAGS